MKTQAPNVPTICQFVAAVEWAPDLRAGALLEEADADLDEAGGAPLE